ncbi:hypothetical protein GF385_01675 [Candidatus Dependentiae bacterium]|nr:hypothetical protein [Candidatus Dependentiae bacterium]
MKNYYWKGMSISGEYNSGNLFAKDPDNLKEILLSNNIALFSFREKNKILSFSLFGNLFNKKILLKQKAFFFEQLYLMLDSGIELLKALNIILDQIKNKKFKKIIKKINFGIEQGNSFAKCLQEFNSVFGYYIINLISAGESSGKLSFVLKKISLNLNHRLSILKKFKQASFLPIITLIFALTLVVSIFIFVIPQFELFFSSFDKELPSSTKLVFKLSSFLRSSSIIYFFVIFLLIIILGKIIFNNFKIRFLKDWFMVRCFFIGEIFIYKELIIFFQTLSMFLESGIDLQQSLSFCKKVINNLYIKNKLKLIEDMVIKGNSLQYSISFIASDFFPSEIIALIDIGENTGKLSEVLKKASKICDEKLKRKLKIITTIIQPVLLIFVGLVVVFLMLSVYLPIFNMAGLL